MGCVYARHKSLWLKFKDETGEIRFKPSGFKLGQEKDAKALLRRIENLVEAGKKVSADGPLTVRKWGESWIKLQREKGIYSADQYEARLRDYVFPAIGHMRLDQVRVGQISEMVAAIKRKKLAPRTVRHIYFTAHTMFEKAVTRELILANPCNIDRDELPAKTDKNPEWRSGAIYTRPEVEALISDDRIPLWRRVFWGLLFLTGERFGEGAARRWRHYQPDATPLGRLVVATSWQSKTKREKETKTGHTRDVPVHATLAAILAEWKLGGWQQIMGRPPTEDDLIVPFPEDGQHLDVQKMRRRLRKDLKLLGYRPRRQHDTRRTFISLCLSDGARKDILKWVTHSRPREDQMDDYTTLLWNPLCEEVAKLKINVRREPVPAVATAGAREVLDGAPEALVTGLVTGARQARGTSASFGEREKGLEPSTSTLARLHSTTELLPRAKLVV